MKEEIKGKIREALEDFALTFAALENDKTYWGYDTDLGKCEEEFDLAEKALITILKTQNQELLKKIEGLDKVKFPRGERKWCIECARRIKKYLKH